MKVLDYIVIKGDNGRFYVCRIMREPDGSPQLDVFTENHATRKEAKEHRDWLAIGGRDDRRPKKRKKNSGDAALDDWHRDGVQE